VGILLRSQPRHKICLTKQGNELQRPIEGELSSCSAQMLISSATSLLGEAERMAVLASQNKPPTRGKQTREMRILPSKVRRSP